MELNEGTIEAHIPYYLTQESKNGLIKALKDFPNNTPYYSRLNGGDILQGDCWTAFGVINYEDGKCKEVKGVVLSNSCDIDPENERDIPVGVIFAPIIKLRAYESLLLEAGFPTASIKNKLDSIRNQRVTTLFYLPAGSGLNDECVALLGDVHTMPLAVFLRQVKRAKIFTLSQVGFYLFLLKLSIHFCRFHEKVPRD